MEILFRIGLTLFILSAFPAFAQNNTPASTAGQSLDQAASDPTASLMSVQLQNLYSGDYNQLGNEHGNTFLIRTALPFELSGYKNIARLTLPTITNSPSGESGLGDLTIFDLVAFDHSWGRWGVGPVLLAPTATKDELGADKWAIGPALGFVAHKEKLLWGVFNQNLFTFAGNDNRADVEVSVIQPIINYSLGNSWSIGTSEMNATYDRDQNKWVSLPLGMKLAKLKRFGKMPVQLIGSYEYNFADDVVVPKWTINFTAKLLFPL